MGCLRVLYYITWCRISSINSMIELRDKAGEYIGHDGHRGHPSDCCDKAGGQINEVGRDMSGTALSIYTIYFTCLSIYLFIHRFIGLCTYSVDFYSFICLTCLIPKFKLMRNDMFYCHYIYHSSTIYAFFRNTESMGFFFKITTLTESPNILFQPVVN